MKVRANRAYAKFRRQLETRPDLFQPWQGAAFRVTTLEYPRPRSILSGEGSFLFGGRWNAAGSFRAVYGSTTDTVAVAESRANAEYAGIPYPFTRPRLLVTVEFSLKCVFDLTSSTMRELGLSFEELQREDWRRAAEEGRESGTQAFGRALFESGANALLAPSARVPNGVNIVYFPGNSGATDEARVCEPEELERIRGRDE